MKKGPIRCVLPAVGGGRIKVRDDSEITCEVHGIKVRYGDLDAIQKLAFEEGIDTLADLPCLLGAQARSE